MIDLFFFKVQKWREKQLEVLEVKRRLEESKRQDELEKLERENERFEKHRQQMKDKVRFPPHSLYNSCFFLSS